MQCERLIKLVKLWYLHVREETMAPARMVQFIKQHVSTCTVCKQDPDVNEEIEKITDIILPESKIPKAVRLKQELDAEVFDEEEGEEEAAGGGTEEETEDDGELEDDEFSDDDDPLTAEDEDDQ